MLGADIKKACTKALPDSPDHFGGRDGFQVNLGNVAGGFPNPLSLRRVQLTVLYPLDKLLYPPPEIRAPPSPFSCFVMQKSSP